MLSTTLCCSTSTARWKPVPGCLVRQLIFCTRAIRPSARAPPRNGRDGSPRVRAGILDLAAASAEERALCRASNDSTTELASDEDLPGRFRPPYVTSTFSDRRLGLRQSLWQHWDDARQGRSLHLGRLVERLLAQPETYWTKAKTARALQDATTGNTRPVDLRPNSAGVDSEAEGLAVFTRHSWHVHRKPGELLRRTPETEPFLDVEFFVHALLDGGSSRPLLTLLGVRDTPTGPDRLDRLSAGIGAHGQPTRRRSREMVPPLDQMIDTCSTADPARSRRFS